MPRLARHDNSHWLALKGHDLIGWESSILIALKGRGFSRAVKVHNEFGFSR